MSGSRPCIKKSSENTASLCGFSHLLAFSSPQLELKERQIPERPAEEPG
jgi:hypothetical protein